MSEIRNLTRNGETFYPLTTMSAVINEDTGESVVIDEEPTAGSNNLVKSGGVYEAINEIVDGGFNTRSELSFVDEEGNCITQFKGGEIETKNFDSRKSVSSDNIDDDNESISLSDENANCPCQIKDGHIKTKYFDSRDIKKSNFASIGIKELTVSGSSKKVGNRIYLYSGTANRAYLDGGFECPHWDMFATFVCTYGGASFVMGKDGATWGAWIEISGSTYTFYNNGKNGQYSQVYTGDFGFTLTLGEMYSLHLFFNTTTDKILGFEITGQYDEYFIYTFNETTCHGYGNPFFYTDHECTVINFSLSNQSFYDIKNAKMAVWGHSLVEADSLGQDRDKSFTNLLANAIGADKVFGFGLGGDTYAGVYSKIKNEFVFVKNICYGLICVGGNDRSRPASYMKEMVDNIADLLVEHDVIPIFATQTPINFTINQAVEETNAYIRENYLFVDFEQVFFDVDVVNGNPTASNIKQNLFLPDHTHPTVEGHRLLFGRIKMDCPFIF